MNNGSKVGNRIGGFLKDNANQKGMIAMQIVAGLIVTFIIYQLALMVMKTDRLYIDGKYDMTIKRRVDIFNGYMDSGNMGIDAAFYTQLPFADSYRPMFPSVNIKGGAQYSYQCWLFVGNPSEAINKPIYIKGDPKKYDYTIRQILPNGKTFEKDVHDYVAFCPMLSFGSEPMTFNVDFNTIDNIKTTMEVKRIQAESSVYRHNMLSLFTGKWFMVTVVFEDNIPVNDFENGIQVKFYVNDTLYQVGRYPSTLKQNNGNFYVFPDGSVPQCRVADMGYFNYAISDQEIRDLARKGPNTSPAVSLSSKSLIPTDMISDYNRMDIYNT